MMDHNVRESTTLAVSAMRDHHHHHDEGQRDQRSSATEAAVVKLAGIAIRFNVRLRSSDMPPHMQEHALRRTRSLLDSSTSWSSPPPPTTTSSTTDSRSTRPNPTHLARALKQEFDSLYGPAWHCVIGASFGSFVTHSAGGFMYFSIDSLSVLLFKTQVLLVTDSTRQNIIS